MADYRQLANPARRKWLQFAAGALSAPLVGVPISKSIGATQLKLNSRADYDVIVIGSGFAGITAARELGHRGFKVALIEARTRLGGRTYSSEFDGKLAEWGGQFFHWVQPHIWGEFARYDLPLEDTAVRMDRTLIYGRDGKPLDMTPEQINDRQHEAYAKFLGDLKRIMPRPFQPLFAAEEIKPLADLSIQDRIDQVGMSPLEADFASGITMAAGPDVDQVSALQVMHLVACAQWSPEVFREAAGRYRLVDGIKSLVDAIVHDSGAEIRLGQPVTRIVERRNEIIIGTPDGELTASAAVLTVPINTLRDIEFSPELPAAHQELLKVGNPNKAFYTYVKTSNDVGWVSARSPQSDRLTMCYTKHVNRDGSCVLVTIGKDSSKFDLNSPDAVGGAIRDLVPDAEMESFASYDWLRDRYSNGSWLSMPTGFYHRIPEFQMPRGRLFFAGGYTSNGPVDEIDGAVESGMRAARQIRYTFSI